jgi:hypothetical protein
MTDKAKLHGYRCRSMNYFELWSYLLKGMYTLSSRAVRNLKGCSKVVKKRNFSKSL